MLIDSRVFTAIKKIENTPIEDKYEMENRLLELMNLGKRGINIYPAVGVLIKLLDFGNVRNMSILALKRAAKNGDISEAVPKLFDVLVREQNIGVCANAVEVIALNGKTTSEEMRRKFEAIVEKEKDPAKKIEMKTKFSRLYAFFVQKTGKEVDLKELKFRRFKTPRKNLRFRVERRLRR